MDERDRYARMLLAIASDLEQRLYPFAGAVRHAAGLLKAAPPPPAPGVCQGCANPVATSARGRPRKWCSDRCRKAAGRKVSGIATLEVRPTERGRP